MKSCEWLPDMRYEDLPELDLCELRSLLECEDGNVLWLEQCDGLYIRLWKAEITADSLLPLMTLMPGLVDVRSAHA